MKTFTGKTKQFNKISVIERSLYQKFGEKKGFSAWNYQHSSGNWTLRFRRDFLRKIMFSGKKISWKYFLYFNQIFVFFCRICSACLSKLRPCFQMNVLREIFFFRTKSFPRVIFRTEAENCRTLHWIFNRKSKVPFKCLEELCRETFVFGKNINRSITCLRSRREFLFGDSGKIERLAERHQHGFQNRILRFQSVLTKKTFFWIDKCLETFFQTLGGFLSDSCKKHPKIAKFLFSLSRATSPCEIHFLQK